MTSTDPISDFINECHGRGMDFSISGEPLDVADEPARPRMPVSLAWRYSVQVGDAETGFHVDVQGRDLQNACARARKALEQDGAC